MNIFTNWETNRVSYFRSTKNNGRLGFGLVDTKIAKDLIVRNHYSKKWNTQFGLINIGVYKNDNLLGVASFGRMMNPKSYKSILKNVDNINSVLELNRLWISDELGRNAESLLISISIKYIKANFPDTKAVQSFADGRLGCGTIYKASNFKYYGFKETIFLEDIATKEVYHKIPFQNTKRKKGFIKLNVLYARNRLKPFKVKTYRYIYPLYKDVEMKLKEEEYPIYEKGLEYIDFKPSCLQVCKVLHILYLDGKKNSSEFQDVYTYLINTFNKKEISVNKTKAINYFTSTINNDI